MPTKACAIPPLADRLRMLFVTEPIEEWKGCFVVATEHKLRVLRPA
jgi:hypothetical protein